MLNELKILKAYVIPLMRVNELSLYGNTEQARQALVVYKNRNLSEEEICNDLKRLIYVSRPIYKNHINHPGHTLRTNGSIICKDVGLLLHCLIRDSHYIELWKSVFDGHVMVVTPKSVIDFTSSIGIRVRPRTEENTVSAARDYYGETLFAQENFKMLSKYRGQI